MSKDESNYKVDRSGWKPGPWDSEPDRVQWKTASGLVGLIVRNQMGNLCGYIGVPKGHLDYEKGYDEVAADVHGGLTYANKCAGHICHVPDPSEPDDVWWLGFDCAHSGDASPSRDWSIFGGTYRDIAYVRGEVESLGEQLCVKGWT